MIGSIFNITNNYNKNKKMSITIKSNKELLFDLVTGESGVITITIESYEKNLNEWKLRIKDEVEYNAIIQGPILVNHGGYDVETGLHNPPTYITGDIPTVKKSAKYREKTYPVDFLNGLAVIMNAQITTPDTFVQKLDLLFQQGLLLQTQQECLAGKGVFQSEATDWIIP